MAEIKKTGRGYQVISTLLKEQTHSRLTWQEAKKIEAEYEKLEDAYSAHVAGIGEGFDD